MTISEKSSNETLEINESLDVCDSTVETEEPVSEAEEPAGEAEELPGEDVASEPEEPVSEAPDASAEEAPSEDEDGPFEPYVVNDATILGDIPDHVLKLKFSLGYGKNRHDKRWPPKAMTYKDFIVGLSNHKVGEKDGQAFIQGTAIGNERKVPAIDALYIMGLDVDSGIWPQQVIEKLTKLGLSAIIYTTHSHMKTDTFLVEASFNQWCKRERIDADVTEENVRRYLIEARYWERWVAESVEVGEVAQTIEGKGWWLSHDAMPKFRIVFPLNEPFVIAKQAMSQLDAINLWKSKLIGLSKVLELPIDQSCLDPSRLFYLPRHAAGAEFGVWVTGGEALVFDEVPEGDIRGRGQSQKPSDNFASHGEQMAREKREHVFTATGDNLTKWAAQNKRSENFDIAALFRNAAPDHIRNEQSESKLTVTCPFDHAHSNAGDLEDQGCYVETPEPATGINSFVFSCSHNSCKGRDRLEFVAEAINQDWFTFSDLEDKDYHLGLTADAPLTTEEALERLTKEIEGLTFDTLDSDLDVILAKLGALDISNKRRSDLFDTLCTNVGVVKGNEKTALKSRLTPHVKAAVAKRQREKTVSAFRQQSGGLPAIDVGGGFKPMLEATVAALTAKNKGRKAFLFDLDGQKVVIDHNAEQVQPINIDGMQAELRRVADFIMMDDDKAKSVDCPRNVATDLYVYRGHATPKLERFTKSPAFAGDSLLVREPGYHDAAKVYYAPPPGFEVPDVPAEPTDEQIKESVSFILDNVLVDFPFDDGKDPETGEERGGDSSRAHALALILLGFMRDLINGPTPIHLITKPLPGTGASLLVEVSTTIPLGSPVASKVEKSEEEEGKEMIAFLRKAGLYYWKDNLQRKLEGSTIATAATNKTFSGRLLSTNDDVELPVRCIFIASGNNVSLADEIARRCLVIRLDAKRDPKKDRTFKHPQIQNWVEENRPELVKHCLTIIQGWIAKGKPRWKGEPLASYSAYCSIMGGVLDVAGLGHAFLANRDLAQEGANPERDAEVAFASAMWRTYGSDEWTAGGRTKGGDTSRDTPLSLIAKNEIDIKLYGHDDEVKTRSLTAWLRKHVGGVWTILDKDGETVIDVRLYRALDKHTKTWFHYLKRIENPAAAQPVEAEVVAQPVEAEPVYTINWADEAAYLENLHPEERRWLNGAWIIVEAVE